MANEKELSGSDGCGQDAKIKTHFAKIIVVGTAEKPYYEILYFDNTDGQYHIGFGSFSIEFVFKWLSEEFEIVDAPTADVVEVVRCKDCKWYMPGDLFTDIMFCHRMKKENGKPAKYNYCDDDFCSYGERRTDG